MQSVILPCQKVGELVSPALIDAISRAIVEHVRPSKIVLFGSYASGTATPDSDADFFIVMDSDLPRYRRSAPIRRLFNPTPCAMDFLVYTPQEVDYWSGTPNHIVTEALNKGRVLYDKAAT